ncbi:MAG: peptide ABC transporter substrate-binding protein [Oscillochloridaceae bacterium]|nr:peptide ABC transporter substrate-binding protein [Chloroflexaceae bacterium]MDW8390748.1 peptide ABC transporter substrate-binding protein [Oscillochloridaceae bacterium]
MARRIRWQIVIATLSIMLIAGLLGAVALRNASVATPLVGGSYVEAVVGAPERPIPLLNDPLADPVGRDLIALIFDGLVRIGADGLIEPALAQSYEVDASGTVYHFNLRRNVTWHDGRPFTADDVVFTLRTLQVADQPAEPALAAVWQDVLVDRLDAYTIRATLTAPFAPFLSMARLPILPAHVFAGKPPEAWTSGSIAERLVGTGPYRLLELREDRAVLVANAGYFGGRPYIERLELRFIASPEAAFAALARGDVTAFGARITGAAALEDLPAGIRGAVVPLDEYTTLSFNLRRPPLNNLNLRRALAHGLNKDALIERALNGTAMPLDTPILPGWWAYNPEARWYAPDPAAAGRILSESGFDRGADGILERDGRPLALELLVDNEPKRRAVADEIARQWGDLGVRISVVELDGPALQARLRAHEFDMALHTWTRLGPDPDPFALWHSSRADTGLNYAGLDDKEIDDLLASARVESELAARSADYAAFQQRWISLAPSITLYQPLYRFAAATTLDGAGLEDPESSLHHLLIGREDRYRDVTRWFLKSYREIQGEVR